MHLWITYRFVFSRTSRAPDKPRVFPVRCFTVWAIMALRRGTVEVNTFHPIDEELQLLEGRYQAASFPVDSLLIVYHLCTSITDTLTGGFFLQFGKDEQKKHTQCTCFGQGVFQQKRRFLHFMR